MSSNPARQPQGQPTGGQFAAKSNPECEVELDGSQPARTVLPNGTVEWRLDGLLHRDDGPAVIWPDNVQSWYQHGVRHRDDGPAVIWPDGSVEWRRHGKKVDPPSDDGHTLVPAQESVRTYYPNGAIRSETYRFNGLLQDPAPGVPAVRHYDHRTGSAMSERCFQDGRLDDPTPDTPANREFDMNGTVRYEACYRDGLLQDPAPDVPAVRTYNANGKLFAWANYRGGQLVEGPATS